MKEKIILILVIIIYSHLSTPIIKEKSRNIDSFNEFSKDSLVADNLWDYLSRFSLN